MAAAEIYDYVSAVTPDYDATLNLCPSETIPEMAGGQEKILKMYDGTEERISFADAPEFALRLRWDFLSESDAGTVFDWYCDTAKAHRTTKTFKWDHPTDGHTYVVRFDESLERVISMGNLMDIAEIRLIVAGRINDA